MMGLMLLWPGTIMAGPSVAELLLVCQHGFEQGNSGLDAAACEWYAAPCACGKRGADPVTSGWCVPASESIDDTVRKVVANLRRHPDQAAEVELVVPEILTRIFPCQTTTAD